jgi:hypothetical protein
MVDPQSVEDLLAIEAIKQLKARYFLLMDTKKWEDWRRLFTDDLRVEGAVTADGTPDSFVDSVRRHLEGVLSCHHGYMPVIEVTSDTTARGTWSMFDDLRFPKNHPWAGKHRRRLGCGFYHEEYRRTSDRWKISSMRLDRLYVWSEPDIGAEMVNHLAPGGPPHP